MSKRQQRRRNKARITGNGNGNGNIKIKVKAKPDTGTGRRELPGAASFTALATLDGQPGVGSVMIGEDHRLYRRTHGLLEMIVPCEPKDDTKPGLWYDKLNRDDYPPMGELATVYDEFLSKYPDREVMFLVGKRYDGTGYFYMVPSQTGDRGSINWQDKEGMDWFAKHARFLGTVHVHPGNGAGPSGTDLEHWKEKACSGIHVIFGRDGSFTMHATVAGYAIFVADGSIEGLDRVPTTWYTSLNRPLDELLLKPKPVKTLFDFGKRKNRDWGRGDDNWDWLWDKWQKDRKSPTTRDDGYRQYQTAKKKRHQSARDEVVSSLIDARATMVPIRDPQKKRLDTMRCVMYEGYAWLMTENQYRLYLMTVRDAGCMQTAPLGVQVTLDIYEDENKEIIQ